MDLTSALRDAERRLRAAQLAGDADEGRCSTWTRRCPCETAIDACHTEYA